MSKLPRAKQALELVEGLQDFFVHGLELVDGAEPFEKTSWLRDRGQHGGGTRYSTADVAAFNRASVNVSQVHYDDDPNKKLGSATALSTIIHPSHPHAPSMHMHISWTEMKGAGESEGSGYWRMMADLNPSIENEIDTQVFKQCMREVAPDLYSEATAQGDRYFYIPALERHRGVAHFYLENYHSNDAAADRQLAQEFGRAVIDGYLKILSRNLRESTVPSEPDKAKQLAYHTLYFFQVLTMDRGTTSGLLVHDQNDVGIMGSLPSHVDQSLLASWRNLLPVPQGELLDGLLKALPSEEASKISTEVKQRIAQVVREHYQKYPEALQLQASGNVLPPTVANHR